MVDVLKVSYDGHEEKQCKKHHVGDAMLGPRDHFCYFQGHDDKG